MRQPFRRPLLLFLRIFFRRVEAAGLERVPAEGPLLVVLNHLVREFDYGVLYTEQQVNETLKRFHADCATLRRQLIENRLMAREKGVYWRISEPAPLGSVG